MPAFSTRYIDDERRRLAEQGSLARQGVIDRSGAPQPALAAPAPVAGGALSNAAPPPPTGQAPEGYPPASPTQASSQVAGAAPLSDGTPFGVGASVTPTQFRGKKKPPKVNTTNKLFEDADPLKVEDALDQSVAAMKNTAKSNPQAFKQMDASLTLKGIDTKAAFMDMRDNLIDAAAKRRGDRASKTYNEKEFKKRWKNVFNIIPEEQMGMFLFDFGLRMLAASSQPGGAGTHAGMAGMGALGGVQERQQRGEAAALEEEKTATEQAGMFAQLDQGDRQFGLDQQRVNIEEQRRQSEVDERNRVRPDDIVWSDQGGFVDRGNGLVGAGIGGKPLRPGDKPGGAENRREFSHEAMLRNLTSVGYSKRDALDMINGAPVAAQRRMVFIENFHDLVKSGEKGVPPGGTQKKKFSEWSERERQSWIEKEARLAEGGGGGGALAGPAQTPSSFERPPGWDDY